MSHCRQGEDDLVMTFRLRLVSVPCLMIGGAVVLGAAVLAIALWAPK